MTIPAILADPKYGELKNFILDYTGLSYYADKDEDLASRISRRFVSRGVSSCSAYLALLRSPAERTETDALVGELTIGETYFFRQREHFDILRDSVFPEVLERRLASRRMRIWSAGCATGPEPYSIDILLELELSHRIAGWDVSILATDLNPEFLAKAREARFGEWALRQTPEWIRDRCFNREGNSWVLRPEFRRRVAFERRNLVAADPDPDPPAAPFDVVMCRNVMIYMSPAVIRRMLARFHAALAPGGWLIVGHAEPNAEMFGQFHPVCVSNVTVYRKPAARVPIPAEAAWAPAVLPSPAAKPECATYTDSVVCSPAAPPVEEVRLLADRGEWVAAARLGRRLTESEPLNATAHFTLGLVLEHTESCQAAEMSLRRAIYLDRDFALAHYHLGTCLQRGRETHRAKKAFDNVLKLLASRPGEETLEHGDGMTVAELKELTRMHLELLTAA